MPPLATSSSAPPSQNAGSICQLQFQKNLGQTSHHIKNCFFPTTVY